jgi:hypothetical protein
MPLFDFKCVKCDKLEERLIPRREIDEQVCGCGERFPMKMSEVPHVTNFSLKGVWFKNTGGY